MDQLSEIITALRPKAYRVGGFEAGGSWSVRFDSFKGIKCYALACGGCWLDVQGHDPPVLLEQGDCFMLPRGTAFRIASDLGLPSDDWRLHLMASQDGTLVKLNELCGTTGLGGHFACDGPRARSLIEILPSLVHLRAQNGLPSILPAIERMRLELNDTKPGRYLIAQQLAFMILVDAFRLHMDASVGVGWLFALSDPQIGAAITAMHQDPARRWTVAGLASRAGMSRSAFGSAWKKDPGSGVIGVEKGPLIPVV